MSTTCGPNPIERLDDQPLSAGLRLGDAHRGVVADQVVEGGVLTQRGQVDDVRRRAACGRRREACHR